jgi:hypothetical protein
MQILFDATRPVQPASRIRPFGSGVLAYSPYYPTAITAEDEAEYRDMLATQEADDRLAREQAARDFDEYLEERAMAYEAGRRVECGAIC